MDKTDNFITPDIAAAIAATRHSRRLNSE